MYKNTACDVCGKMFVTTTAMEQHREAKHGIRTARPPVVPPVHHWVPAAAVPAAPVAPAAPSLPPATYGYAHGYGHERSESEDEEDRWGMYDSPPLVAQPQHRQQQYSGFFERLASPPAPYEPAYSRAFPLPPGFQQPPTFGFPPQRQPSQQNREALFAALAEMGFTPLNIELAFAQASANGQVHEPSMDEMLHLLFEMPTQHETQPSPPLPPPPPSPPATVFGAVLVDVSESSPADPLRAPSSFPDCTVEPFPTTSVENSPKAEDLHEDQQARDAALAVVLAAESVAQALEADELARLRRRVEELEAKLNCKVCMEEPVSAVFMPCGHHVCCHRCASGPRICPICRKAVEAVVRTFSG
eukprot:TRINITY_DN57231_c0_g1_i1.p1 TRINITY_DN57231_c0_g1~~TRINITY_DN57231_c0_g1_i1.p1  ORF type:complete len:392 (+),score=50.22 TRINITY_DN57231_c0_g1_i1:101-1177(+)